MFTDGTFRQGGHKFFQPLPVFNTKRRFQSICQCPFQAAFPAGTFTVQISAPPRQLAAGVNKYPIGCPHHTHQSSFREHSTAANARPLWNMLNRFGLFLRHLNTKSLYNRRTRLTTHHPRHRHAYVFCGQQPRHVLHQTRGQPISFPFCPSSFWRFHHHLRQQVLPLEPHPREA